jgi:hypothetical protein
MKAFSLARSCILGTIANLLEFRRFSGFQILRAESELSFLLPPLLDRCIGSQRSREAQSIEEEVIFHLKNPWGK